VIALSHQRTHAEPDLFNVAFTGSSLNDLDATPAGATNMGNLSCDGPMVNHDML